MHISFSYGLDEIRFLSYFKSMPIYPILLSLLLGFATLHAGPANEKVRFEADTLGMSKEEVKNYMGRGPDLEITPHLLRYSGSWTSTKFGEGLDTYNTVDLAFGTLTDSHKYGVMEFNWSVQ